MTPAFTSWASYPFAFACSTSTRGVRPVFSSILSKYAWNDMSICFLLGVSSPLRRAGPPGFDTLQNLFHRSIHIGRGGRPVRHRDPHRGLPAPRRTGHPGGAVALDLLDDLRRALAEAHQHLVERHLVQHVRLEPLRESLRHRTAPLHKLDHTTPPQRPQRR